ncbi:hypothetical protein HY633_03210 [Candidatus Uhrbacteria bacterium]|nr:hypothetical protein [Candidatus Uhrbacteria bacterium]
MIDLKKALPFVVVAAVVFGAGGFFGGQAYAKSKAPGRAAAGEFRAAGQGGRGAQGPVGASGARRGGLTGPGGFVIGEILKKDDASVTVTLPDGGSKIIFLSEKTQVQKTTEAALADLAVGTRVRVTGSQNDDGSVSAQTVQIVPAGMVR